MRDAFVLVFINVKSRQSIVSSATLHPNEAWITAQADAFVTEARRRGLRVRRLQHDRDTKFAATFTNRLKSHRVQCRRSAFCAPNLNAYVERFIQTIQKECLDHFVILGARHLDYLCAEFLTHYHEERPHQSLENEPITYPLKTENRSDSENLRLGDLRCRKRLGGLLKSYSRHAA